MLCFRLHAAGGLNGRIAKREPLTNRRIRAARRWAAKVQNWTVDRNRRHMVFSDEFRFKCDGRTIVWRREGERYAPACLNPPRCQRRASLMFWGCIGFGCAGHLVEVQRNIDRHNYFNNTSYHQLMTFSAKKYKFRLSTGQYTSSHSQGYSGAVRWPGFPADAMARKFPRYEHHWDRMGAHHGQIKERSTFDHCRTSSTCPPALGRSNVTILEKSVCWFASPGSSTSSCGRLPDQILREHVYTLENRNGSWRIELLRKGFWGRGTVPGCGVTVSLMLCVNAYTYI